ncbi:MAG: entericidin A/B family lipoprotein [Zoogloea sp.]|nr:entericidin A/B family lipoprotein [Zoogloea sp.]
MRLFGLVVVGGLVSAGCNTMYGVGKDVERGGEKMQRSSSTVIQDVGRGVEHSGQAIQEKAKQ